MSTTAIRPSAAALRASPPTPSARPRNTSAHRLADVCGIPIIDTPQCSELERPSEREQYQALLIVGLGVECLPELDAEGTHGRQPADARAHRVAGGVEREPVGARDVVATVGVAGVDEHHTLQPDALRDREDDLVVQDDLAAAADRVGGDHASERVLA